MLLPAQAHDASSNYGNVAFKTALTMVKILDICCHNAKTPRFACFFQGPILRPGSKRPGVVGVSPDTAPNQRRPSPCASGQRAPPQWVVSAL
jgi:hypothetical protein